jgi:hypothetical protein
MDEVDLHVINGSRRGGMYIEPNNKQGDDVEREMIRLSPGGRPGSGVPTLGGGSWSLDEQNRISLDHLG